MVSREVPREPLAPWTDLTDKAEGLDADRVVLTAFLSHRASRKSLVTAPNKLPT